MKKVDIKELFEAGAHFGHKTSRWHPKMAPYIHSKRGDTHIIDLAKTVEALEETMQFVEKNAASGKQILFVGTKRQAQPIVEKAAQDSGQPYVVVRWLGGMLTNESTMRGRVKHLKKLEERMESGELASRYSKLEVQRFQEEIDELNRIFGGVKDMNGQPGAVFVTDAVNDTIAVKEAKRLNIPVIALVDTNANPSGVDYVIPSNDDALQTIQLMCDYIVSAVEDGKKKVKKAEPKEEKAEKPAKKAEEKKEDKKEESK